MSQTKALELKELTLQWVERFNNGETPDERIRIFNELATRQPTELLMSVHNHIVDQVVADLNKTFE